MPAVDTQFKPIHGHTSSRTDRILVSPTYRSWMKMKDRVLNPNHKFYSLYGGRGIDICNRWLKSFQNFLADMGERPSGTCLERRNNDKGYSPDNCYWATRKQQARNRSNNTLLTFKELTKPIAEWAECLNLPAPAIRARLRNGWTVDRALTEPLDLRFSRRKLCLQ